MTPVLALAFAAACGGDSAPPATSVRGATLVQEVRIDGHAHDLVPFGGTSGGAIAVAADGTIAISQMQDHVVRFFSAGGEPLGEFGGDGSGPGEFERNTRVGWVGDSLWVYDPGLRRVTVLTPHHEFARTVTVNREPKPAPTLQEVLPRMAASYPVAMQAGGARTELLMPLREASPPSAANEVYFASVTEQAELTSIVAAIPVGETSVRDDRGGSASLPLANRPVFDVSRDGSRAGFARAEVSGGAGEVAVHLFGTGGDTIFSRRLPIELVPLPDAVRDSVYERWIDRLPSSLGQAVRARADEVTVYPPLEDLIIGRDGTVWIALAKRDGQRPHIILDPAGEPLGELLLDERSRIAEAQRDRIWVIETDEFDVESLVRYAVRW